MSAAAASCLTWLYGGFLGCMRVLQLQAWLLGSYEPGCWRVGRAAGGLR